MASFTPCHPDLDLEPLGDLTPGTRAVVDVCAIGSLTRDRVAPSLGQEYRTAPIAWYALSVRRGWARRRAIDCRTVATIDATPGMTAPTLPHRSERPGEDHRARDGSLENPRGSGLPGFRRAGVRTA